MPKKPLKTHSAKKTSLSATNATRTPRASSTPAPKWLQLFDEYALLIMSAILLSFIPLYPKLPLFDLIEGYIVRARIEDLLIGITGLVFLIQLWRKKVSLATPLTPAVLSYAVAGFLTITSAVFLTGTVPLETIHVAKSVLHYVRYLEYFALFFILFTSIKTRKHVLILLGIVFVTLAGVVLYGYGQKYWYWPVYSTMNREFSKGIRLYLTEHARVQSTFGGHYDMAAYLVVVTPFVLTQFFITTRKRFKLLLGVLYLGATWLLVASGSRSSFVGFVIGNLLTIPLVAIHKSGWGTRVAFTLRNGVFLSILYVVFMLVFGQDMYDRFLQTLAGYPTINSHYHDFVGRSKTFVQYDVPVALGLREENIKQIANVLPKAEKPTNGLSTDDAAALYDVPVALGLREENIKQIANVLPKAEKPTNGLSTDDAAALVASDQRPVPDKPGDAVSPTTKPPDVYVDVPVKEWVATTSATGEISYIEVEKPREFSQTAQQRGLSEAIRLDALWPQAVRGFLANPVLGSGYGTLNKESTYHFTEAESTDNNFLRTLGETGLFGFISFYAVVLFTIFGTWQYAKPNSKPQPLLLALNVALLSGTVGLLINAFYIDVFAASKVAMTYWALVGLVLAANTVLPRLDAPKS